MAGSTAEQAERRGSGCGRIFGLLYVFAAVVKVVAIGHSYGILPALLSLWGLFIVGNLFVVRKPFNKRMVDLTGSSLVIMVLVGVEPLRSHGFSYHHARAA